MVRAEAETIHDEGAVIGLVAEIASVRVVTLAIGFLLP
jgi:hypothetical protein